MSSLTGIDDLSEGELVELLAAPMDELEIENVRRLVFSYRFSVTFDVLRSCPILI